METSEETNKLPVRTFSIPKIRAESEAQTSGHIVKIDKNSTENMEDASKMGLRKRRNISRNRAQATRTREKTPEPSRTPIPHDDLPTTDDEEIVKPKNSRELEADKNYEEMKRMIEEKSGEKDQDDYDIDEIIEQRNIAENERRRRSISPFALPDKDDLAAFQRKGSFVDPNNKLLSTCYNLSPKDDGTNGRKVSLSIDTESRKSSISSLSPSAGPSTSSPRDKATFIYPPSLTDKKLEKIIYPDEENTSEEVIKAAQPPLSIQKKPNTPDEHYMTDVSGKKVDHESTELKTKIIQIERSPSKKLSDENKPKVEVQQRVSRTPSKKEMRPVLLAQQAAKDVKLVEERNVPIKPARSKSASRFGGRTSESEMSEDQNQKRALEQWKPTKRFFQTPKRFLRKKSPRAMRSQSVTRVEDILDKTGKSMSQTGRDIIALLESVRGRSMSPKYDGKSLTAVNMNATRTLRTPTAMSPLTRSPPLSRRTRGVSCPKTIQIINQTEIINSLKKVQTKNDELERSRKSSGYVDASQSEYSTSCYSTTPSENEFEFDLLTKTEELKKKLSILSSREDVQDTTESELSHQKVGLRKRHHNRKVETKLNKTKAATKVHESVPLKQNEICDPSKMNRFKRFFWSWRQFKEDNKYQYSLIKNDIKKCIADTIILIIMCGLGGIMFKTLEGSYENAFKCNAKNVKRDFIEHLWRGSSHMREEDWKSMARNKLFEFENQLHEAHEAGVSSYSGRKTWNFMNSFVYCLTVLTTIGYGHLAPKTYYGMIATIVYAIIGIPLFLIVLADFGKVLTRIIKFLWAFVRRLYYTGSCKKVRRTAPMQEMMKGFNMVYDVVRRPSQVMLDETEKPVDTLNPNGPPPLPPKPGQTPDPEVGTEPETPGPYEIDDEFNLPISLAIIIQIMYIVLGATLYSLWESWTFFESFYFVFISMSTIGFGDYVPDHPMFMMASIIYLVFGLALTSMCINVVQLKLSDTFRQATAKIGATIGFQVAEEDGAMVNITPDPVEVTPVHGKFEQNSER